MPCYHPMTGWRSRQLEPSGKRKIVFDRKYGFTDMEVQIPCGQCIGCRLERSRQWALRCVHEAQLHDENCFITLTYNNENLPSDGGLVKRDYQLFMKKLRKHLGPKKIKFYQCGEYGSVRDSDGQVISGLLGRPHYHAILFGHQFSDLELYREKRGVKLYISETLAKIWGKGFVTVGEVTFESAAYVARYVVKKISGEQSELHYTKPDSNGELHKVIPEYTTMSRGGRNGHGIAHDWFINFKDDLKKDFITQDGKKMKPPKYYDDLMEKYEPETFDVIKGNRRAAAKADNDNGPDRRESKEKVKKAQAKMLVREL